MKTYNYYRRDGEYWFEWVDEKSKHVTKCSFHGCLQLGEQFDKFGYDLDTACEFNEMDVNENSAGGGEYELTTKHGYFSNRWYDQK